MNNTGGAIHFEITASNDDLKRKLAESRQALLDSGRTAEEQGSKIESMFKRAAIGAGVFFSAQQALQFAKQIAVVRGEFQQLEVSFSTLLQSKEKANILMAQMVELAAKTPFSLRDVAQGAKQLVAYGFAAEEVNDTMLRLGNVAAGLGLPMERLTYLYGTTMTQGRLYARDLMQFTTSGIPMLQGLADMFGVTTEEVNKMVSAGKVGFPEVKKVIENLTSEGGKFHGLMEDISKTITGRISNLGDAIDVMFNKMGQSQEGFISSSIDMATSLVKNYEQIGNALLVLISAYGTYKAALIAVSAYHKAMALYETTKGFGQMTIMLRRTTQAQILLNQAMGANPILKIISLLVAAGTALYLFTRESNDANESLTGLAKAINDAGAEFDKESSKAKALQDVMNNSKVAYDERKRALNELKSIIPGYNAELNNEGVLINNNTEAIKQYLTQLERQIKLKAVKEELENAYKDKFVLEKDYDTKYKDWSSKNTNSAYHDKPIIDVAGMFGGRDLQKAEKAKDEAKQKLNEIEATISSLNSEIEKTADSTGGATDEVKSFSKQVQDTAAEITELTQKLKDLRAGKIGSNDFAKDIEETDKSLKDAQARYDLLLGLDRKNENKSTNDSDSTKAFEAHIEAERKLKDALVNMQFDTEQARIEAMADGLDKELAQIELNYTKKQTAIELWEREQRQIVVDAQKTTFIAQGGKEQDFKVDGSDPAFAPINKSYDAKTAANNAEQTASNEKLLTDLKAQWQTWADDYQQIEDQITATRANADRDRRSINEAHKAGKIDNTEAMTATRKVDSGEQKQIANLESQKTKLSSSWEQVFRDLQGMSRSQVKILISEINDQLSNSELSPADHSALLEQLDKAKDYATTLNPFASFVDGINDVKTATEALGKAKRALEATKITYTPEQEKKAAEQAVKEAEKALADKKKERNEAASKSLGDISGMASATSDLLKTFGVESPAVDGVVGALGSLASIDFTNPMSIITGGLGAIANLLGGIFGEVDKRKEQQIADIQRTVDSITESYDKLDKAIGKAYSNDAADLIGDEIKMREQQRGLIEQQKKIEESRKNPDDGALEGYDKAIDDINSKIEESKEAACDAIFGSDVQSAIDEFASAYMNSWASGEDRAQSQKDVVKNMLRGIIKEMLKADIKGSVEKMRKEIEGFMSDDVLNDMELSEIDKMGDEIGRIMEERGKIYDKILKDDKPIDKDETSLSGQIRGTVATEQSVSELGGIFRGMADTGRRIEIGLDLGFKTVAEMARTQLLIEANTRRSADNTDGLTSKIDATNTKLDTLISKIKPDNGSY